jgi:hypothetical protein
MFQTIQNTLPVVIQIYTGIRQDKTRQDETRRSETKIEYIPAFHGLLLLLLLEARAKTKSKKEILAGLTY